MTDPADHELRPTGTRQIAVIVTCLTMAAAMAFVWLEPRMTGDTFIMLSGGRDVFDGKLGQPDDWAFTTQGRVWMNQNWGAGALFYLAQRSMGETGVVAIKAALIAVMAASMLMTARRFKAGWAVGMLVTAAALIAMHHYIDMRPNLIALTAFPSLLCLLYWTTKRPNGIWLAMVFVTVWSHMHGSYIFALAVMGLWALCAAGTRWYFSCAGQALGRTWPLFVAPIGATALATLTSPFGLRNVTQPFSEIGGPQGHVWRSVSEWQPIFTSAKDAFGSPRELFVMLGLIGAVAITWLAHCKAVGRHVIGRLDPDWVAVLLFQAALLAITVYMAFSARRFIPLSLLAATPLLAFGLQWLLNHHRLAWPAAVLAPALVAAAFALQPLLEAVADQSPSDSTAGQPGIAQTLLTGRHLAWAMTTLALSVTPLAAMLLIRMSGAQAKRTMATDEPASNPQPMAWPTVVLCAVLLVALIPKARFIRWHYGTSNLMHEPETFFKRMVFHSAFPGKAAAFLNDNRIGGRAFNGWRWEGYLRWHCPQIKLFNGGRARQVYDTQTHTMWQSIVQQGRLDLLDRQGVELIVVGPGDGLSLMAAMTSTAQSPWVVIYHDAYTWVLVRSDVPRYRPLIEKALSQRLEYPDPAVAGISRAFCLFTMGEPVAVPDLVDAATEVNLLWPTPSVYLMLGQLFNGGKVSFQWLTAYLESEARRLAAIDHHRPQGILILNSRVAIARMLGQIYYRRGQTKAAVFWLEHHEQLSRVLDAATDGRAEPPVRPLPARPTAPGGSAKQ